LVTIRSRLLVGFVLMALLPAIGISFGTVVLGYFNDQKRTLDRLQSAAALRESEIDFWLDSLRHESVARALEAGLKLAAGSDRWTFAWRAEAMANELRDLVACGCNPTQAIQAATGRAAEPVIT
jgi:imidazolonepropionase-like amidohydrolase